MIFPTLDDLTDSLPNTRVVRSFLSHLTIGAVPAHAPDYGPCLTWKDAKTSDGYGAFNDGSGTKEAHRWLYEKRGLIIPDGHELDHLCHEWTLCTVPARDCPHRPCVLHTAAVLKRDNILRGNGLSAVNARKVRCTGKYAPVDAVTGQVLGHLLTDETGADTANCYRTPDGRRNCKACHLESDRQYRQRARLLRAQAREHGLREAGYLALTEL